MKNYDYINSKQILISFRLAMVLIFLILQPIELTSQIERAYLETYYISDANDATDTIGGDLLPGSVTYRYYVDLRPGTRILNMYGDNNHPIKFQSTEYFFNNIDGSTYAKDITRGKYSSNTVALDTWLTIGQSVKTTAGKTNHGVLKRSDRDGSFIGGSNNDGGSAALPQGLLTNSILALGIPLTESDGMDTSAQVISNWSEFGIKNLIFGTDSTIFGSLVKQNAFFSRNCFLKNSGVRGVNADSNLVLLGQFTTKGNLSFQVNLELEIIEEGVTKIVKYVANDSVLLSDEKVSSYLTYPFPPPNCGCKDPDYLEYNANLECEDNENFCKTRIKFGCMDSLACNYDRGANYHLKDLCCYPGLCANRNIQSVCPQVSGESFTMSFFPNPVETILYLNLISGTVEPTQYIIYNYYGNSVKSKDLGNVNSLYNHEIKLDELENGLYLLKVISGKNYLSKQFIKE
jgi:hypothetical protein